MAPASAMRMPAVAFLCATPFTIPAKVKSNTALPFKLSPPYCAKSPRPKSPRPRKPSRPDPANPIPPGFTRAKRAPTPSPAPEDDPPAKPDKLKTPDANGITLEHRLREEIQHPLRKPKQTLFATLTFSATIGLLFACGRFAAEKDTLEHVAQNVAIDFAAISLFAYLTWREYQFGRRSLNSIAGRPQPRDLCVLQSGQSKPRLSSFLLKSDVLIAAGRQVDLLRYFDRCTDSPHESTDVTLVALTVDAQNGKEPVSTDSVLAADADAMEDWIAWLGDAIPPRRNIALFRLEKRENATLPASAYVVAVEEPLSVPLPDKARRPKVVDV